MPAGCSSQRIHIMRNGRITRIQVQYVETKSCQRLLAKVLLTFEITLVNELFSIHKIIPNGSNFIISEEEKHNNC
jgi:hypothetical protein